MRMLATGNNHNRTNNNNNEKLPSSSSTSSSPFLSSFSSLQHNASLWQSKVMMKSSQLLLTRPTRQQIHYLTLFIYTFLSLVICVMIIVFGILCGYYITQGSSFESHTSFFSSRSDMRLPLAVQHDTTIGFTALKKFKPQYQKIPDPIPTKTIAHETQHHRIAVGNELKQNTDSGEDGCGLEENARNVQWRHYDAKDMEIYNRIEQCITKFYDPGAYLDSYESKNFRRLKCSQNVDLDSILSTLQKYHTIYLLGDSVLQQQFIGLMCTVDPAHQNVDPIGKMDVHIKDWYFFNYTHALGVTQFKFYKVGFLFDEEQKAFFKTHFPSAIKVSTANDAIILHVGGHYRSGNAHHMEPVLKYMVKRSVDSRAPIFLVEPNIEEFPTRNGLFTTAMYINHIACQPLTWERMFGRGQMAPNVNFTYMDNLDALPESIFQDLYPGKAYESILGNETYKCMPDCTPQQWRLDMVRKRLKGSKIHIIPVWWQIAALNLQHGLSTARKPGDCIHKDISTIINMNDQLIRAMMSI